MPTTILALVDHYLPGIKAGGPVRSVAHIVERLGRVYRFLVVTRDRDFGDSRPYPDAPPASWHPVGQARTLYLPPSRLGVLGIRKVLRETPHDLLYLNSLFSARMTLVPLLLRRLRLVSSRPTVVAPRGELHRGALATGTWWGLLPQRAAGDRVTPRFVKKWLYVHICRALGFFDGVVWQASSDEEASDIRRWIGSGATVVVACDLSGELPPPRLPRRKRPGLLRLAFVSRIAPKKNLVGAIQFLQAVRAQVEFDVYGPIDEPAYWKECRRVAKALPDNVRLRYHGLLEHSAVAQVLDEHDLLILPTWGENFGHVILEALVSGCPVLVSDQTPWRGLAEAGVGWDLPLSDGAAFTRVLEEVAAMGPDEHAQWSSRAGSFGRRCAVDESAIDRTRMLFDRAVASAGGPVDVASPPASSAGGAASAPSPGGRRSGAPRV